MKYSVVIPNYNGLIHLQTFFPSIYQFCRSNGIEEIIIADDYSSDDSVGFLQANYSDVKVIVNSRNLGFGENCNQAISQASGDYIFLFNTDIEIKSIEIPKLDNFLLKKDFFALTFKSLNPDKSFREGAKQLKIKNGLPFTLHNEKDQTRNSNGEFTSIYPVGGHCILYKKRFLELGGFSKAYSPFYWEDMDLGFRAAKKGWTTYFDPTIIIIHHHCGSIKNNFQKKIISNIKLRNRIIFMYQNFSFREQLFLFYPGMIIRSLSALFRFKFSFFRAWKEAKAKVRN